MGAVIAVVAVVAFVAAYLTWTAGRLDRLHARVDAARASLDAQLVRRAAVAVEVATLLDTDARLLLERAAHDARAWDGEHGPAREDVENALGRALNAGLDAVGVDRLVGRDAALADELGVAATKVVLARRFFNDAVRDTLSLRHARVVRWLRLAGRAPLPRYFEIDDTPPPSLASPPVGAA